MCSHVGCCKPPVLGRRNITLKLHPTQRRRPTGLSVVCREPAMLTATATNECGVQRMVGISSWLVPSSLRSVLGLPGFQAPLLPSLPSLHRGLAAAFCPCTSPHRPWTFCRLRTRKQVSFPNSIYSWHNSGVFFMLRLLSHLNRDSAKRVWEREFPHNTQRIDVHSNSANVPVIYDLSCWGL